MRAMGAEGARSARGPNRLAEQLLQRRHALFVGRERERARFLELVEARRSAVLFFYGEGGIGKTALLHELLYACGERGIAAARIDGGQVDVTHEAIRAAVDAVLPVCVLMIDTFEALAPIEPWIRDELLPALAANVLVVLAGRAPPSSAWRTDAGWHRVLERVALDELSATESEAYLAVRGVPDREHAAILAFTGGHALALALVTDLCEHAPTTRFAVERAHDVVRVLVEQLVRELPSDADRHALEACAVARTTTEPLLATMLDVPDAHAAFAWLRGLAFVQSDQVGLFPHELARKAVVADLQFRDPDRLRLLNERAMAALVAPTRAVDWRVQAIDGLYSVFQLLPAGPRALLRARGVRGLSPEAATPRDLAALVAMVGRHEGHASAAIAEHWFARQPHNVTVIRDGSPEPAGLFAIVTLDALGDEDVRIDPAIGPALRHRGVAGAGRTASLFRFWMARDTHQALSPVQALCASLVNQHQVTTPTLDHSFLPFVDPVAYQPFATLAGFTRTPSLDFEVGGRRYGVFARDWRRTPPLEFLSQLVQTGHPPREELPLLSEAAFATNVRLALHQLGDPLQLADNPLAGVRSVTARARATDPPLTRVEALRALVGDAIATLGGTPRNRKLRDALQAMFIDQLGTQEAAAEALGVPFSTFRRHLAEGTALIVELLWRRELGA